MGHLALFTKATLQFVTGILVHIMHLCFLSETSFGASEVYLNSVERV